MPGIKRTTNLGNFVNFVFSKIFIFLRILLPWESLGPPVCSSIAQSRLGGPRGPPGLQEGAGALVGVPGHPADALEAWVGR